MVLDFGALPPEINSGRIYSGPGSAPLLAAATAWDALASELQTTAASYASTITELTTRLAGPFFGGCGRCRGALHSVAEQHRRAGRADGIPGPGGCRRLRGRLRCQRPATGDRGQPGAVGGAGRYQLPGQNTPAIAATEATYAEFWAQDAVAMYGYAGAATTASQLTPFTAAPATTNDSGQATQSAAAANSAAAMRITTTSRSIPDAAEHRTDSVRHRAHEPQQRIHVPFPRQRRRLTGLPTSVTNGITVLEKAITTFTSTVSTYAAGPWSLLGVGSLIKNWYQIDHQYPEPGCRHPGYRPVAQPQAHRRGVVAAAAQRAAERLVRRRRRMPERCRRRSAGPAPSVRCRCRRTGRRPSRRSGRLRPRWTRLRLTPLPRWPRSPSTGCSARRRCRAWPAALSAGLPPAPPSGQGLPRARRRGDRRHRHHRHHHRDTAERGIRRGSNGFRFRSATTGGHLRQDLLGPGRGVIAGRRDGLGGSGRRVAVHRLQLPIGDLRADQWRLAQVRRRRPRRRPLRRMCRGCRPRRGRPSRPPARPGPRPAPTRPRWRPPCRRPRSRRTAPSCYRCCRPTSWGRTTRRSRPPRPSTPSSGPKTSPQ